MFAVFVTINSKEMEELNELKNLVMQNLEKNGYLSNIRAQIRASVFKTIDGQESSKRVQELLFRFPPSTRKMRKCRKWQRLLKGRTVFS